MIALCIGGPLDGQHVFVGVAKFRARAKPEKLERRARSRDAHAISNRFKVVEYRLLEWGCAGELVWLYVVDNIAQADVLKTLIAGYKKP